MTKLENAEGWAVVERDRLVTTPQQTPSGAESTFVDAYSFRDYEKGRADGTIKIIRVRVEVIGEESITDDQPRQL